jgi:hypothetical protein
MSGHEFIHEFEMGLVAFIAGTPYNLYMPAHNKGILIQNSFLDFTCTEEEHFCEMRNNLTEIQFELNFICL